MRDADAQTLIIGWGAQTFYTTISGYQDITAKAVWRGFFGDSSVIRMDITGALPAGHGLPAIRMSDAQYSRFLEAVLGSFNASSPTLRGGFTPTDAFFPAKGQFHILNACNVWIGAMLRSAGVRFGRWTPLPLSVTLSHRLFHRD
jgi:uncharacterized protein (TIGR02117 family)